jgi:hypothetical protein
MKKSTQIIDQREKNAVIPESIHALNQTLAENMVRVVPFELLDEAVSEFLRDIKKCIMEKYGVALFKAAFLMELREKILVMEASGPTRCEPNMHRRLSGFNQLVYPEA